MEWLNGLRKDLREKTYRPLPVRRVMMQKPGGGRTPTGYPDDTGPGGANRRETDTGTDLRGGHGAECVRLPAKAKCGRCDSESDKLLYEGYTDVVDADLSKYFDTIPHSELLQCVARRIVDRAHAASDQDVADRPRSRRGETGSSG